MEIRQPEGVDDLRAATAAHNRAWRVGYRGMAPGDVVEAQLRPTDDDSLEALDDEVTSDPGPFLVAEREDAVVGFVRAHYAGCSEFVVGLDGEIVDLVVDPAHWRHGVGTALLDAAVDWLPAMIDGVSIAGLAENDRARSFLDANGFDFVENVEIDLGGTSFEHAVYRDEFED